MPTTVNIYGIVAPTGKLLRARIRNPDGSSAGEFALTENVNGSAVGLKTYSGSGSLTLANALSGNPYTQEVREVLTQNTAGFDASVTVRGGPSPLGWVKSNVILLDPYLDAAVSGVSGGGGGGGGSVTFNVGSIVVDWNYNGMDMRVLSAAGGGLSGKQVFAYVASEYAANPTSAILRGYAVTDDEGKWFAMGLSTGVTYTMVADPRNGTQVKFATLTV